MAEQSTLSPYGFKDAVDVLFASKLVLGLSTAEAARQSNIKPATAYAKKDDPQFRDAFRKFSDDVLTDTAAIKTRIEVGANLALDRLIDTLTTTQDDKVVAQIGFGLLDRAGHSVKQIHEVVTTIKIDKEDAQALNKAFRETIDVGDTGEQSKEQPAPSFTSHGAGNGEAGHAKEPGQVEGQTERAVKSLSVLPS